MGNYRRIMTLLFGCLIVGGGWVYAQRDGSAGRPIGGADITEIHQLYSRYNQGFDFRDVELYLSAYTDDGVLTTGTGDRFAGKSRMRQYLATSFARGEASIMHHTTSILITPTREGANGRAYWTAMNVLAQPPSIAGVGHYLDTFVRTGDGWRIKARTIVRGGPRPVREDGSTGNR